MKALLCAHSELSPIQTALLRSTTLLPISQRRKLRPRRVSVHGPQTELHRALGYHATPRSLNKVVGEQRRLEALSLLPPEPPTPFFCSRDQSLFREELSGLKQLEHPWESGSKTVLETAGQGQTGAPPCSGPESAYRGGWRNHPLEARES